ncbi:MAG: hypothetical protein MUC52_01605 [Candidatus Omnitrophica bacterium]|jgi:hypothetical protein|nr:hypothetical protein [Candidatus Omnitrophota bacterium]
MTRSKRSLRNSARAALNNLIPAVLCFCLCGCFFLPGKQAYNTQNLTKTLQDLALADYKTELSARLVGSTLWIYMPVTDLFVQCDLKDKSLEKFRIAENYGQVKGSVFKGKYNITAVPIKDKSCNIKINKEISEKIGDLWKLIRRVLFGIDKSQKDDIKFVSMVIADIKNGYEIKEIFYARDLKRVSYGLMSIFEFQHRVIQDSYMSPLVIGDKAGRHVEYKDITLPEFVQKQIEYRINLKFSKPEVEQSADINKEVSKIITETLQIYNLTDVGYIEFTNYGSNSTVTLTDRDIWGKIKK